MQAGEGVLSPKSGRRLPAKSHEKKPPDSRPDEAQAALLERVRPDKVTLTRPEEDRRRRTILIEKLHGSFGFTIQSYGIQYRRDSEVEIITYIDHVETTGPAAKAGMREGDVILSINGQDMEQYDHQDLVAFIKQCPDRLRMVVLFEDCVRKVSLHMRYIQLQRQLTDRMYALEQLCEQEKHFIANLRAQGRRIPAFYPAQAGYRGRTPLPQPPHGPPPSYAEAVGRRPQPQPRYLCYHRSMPGRPGESRWPDPRRPELRQHYDQWRGRGKSWDNLSAEAAAGRGGGGGGGGAGAGCERRWRPADDRQLLLDSGFPALHRARAKAAKSAESLLAPGSEFDTSCFSCDCLRTFPGDPARRGFSKPKSVENLLLAARGGTDSLRREKGKEKRRSSLKLGRKGSRSALVSSEDASERSDRP